MSNTTARVTYKGDAASLQRINAGKINVYVDIWDIDKAGTYDLPLTATLCDGTRLSDISPRRVKVTLDDSSQVTCWIGIWDIRKMNIPHGWTEAGAISSLGVRVTGRLHDVYRICAGCEGFIHPGHSEYNPGYAQYAPRATLDWGGVLPVARQDGMPTEVKAAIRLENKLPNVSYYRESWSVDSSLWPPKR